MAPNHCSYGVGTAFARADEPRFDLVWIREQAVWVAEVKSITGHSGERQLHTAMGQVLRYRQKLTARGDDVQAVIITSGPATDGSCDDLCRWEGIVLAWPEAAAAWLSTATEGQ